MSPSVPRIAVGQICLWLLLALSATASHAQERFPARDLTMKGIYGTIPHDGSIYCLVGAGACLVPQDKGIADVFIANWFMAHPNATVIPISTEAKVLPLRAPPRREIFVWIEDGPDSLSLSLVREGFDSAQAMTDMVDADKRFTDLQDKAFSNDQRMRTEIEKRRSQVPEENRPRRLIPDSDYAERMKQAMAAEEEAKQQKKELWSDAAKRQRNTPTADPLMLEDYSDHKSWFNNVASLINADPHLELFSGA